MIGCIIQARRGSTRLPDKIMMPIDENDTVLTFGINQVKSSKLIDKIIIATTELSEDDLIVKHMEKRNISCFRGNSKDVLDRYYQCAKKFNLSIIVRITSDCPLIDPLIIDNVVSHFLKNDEFDYVSNAYPIRTFPDGNDVEIFTFDALEKTWNEARKPSEREHVTPFIYTSKKFRLGSVKNLKDLTNLRWTVDHKEDLDLILEIVKRIHHRPISMPDILKLFSKFPDLKEINKNISQNEGYLKSLKEDKNFLKS